MSKDLNQCYFEMVESKLFELTVFFFFCLKYKKCHMMNFQIERN